MSRLCCVGSRRAGVRVSRSTRPSHGCIHSSNTRSGTGASRVIRFGRDGLGRRRRRDDEMAIGDSKEDLSAFSREDLVYKAKLAEQAERYATTMRCDARCDRSREGLLSFLHGWLDLSVLYRFDDDDGFR